MFMTVVAVSFLGGLNAGLLAAVASTLALWFVNTPPGFSFRLEGFDEALAVVAAGVVAIGLAVMSTWFRNRERRAIEHASALEWARAVDGETILALQQAVLPTIVPEVEGVTITARYHVGGGRDAPVGGDWFAYLPLDGGRIGVAVGDVVGHGIEAVASMAEYRYTFRAIAAEGVDADGALNRLEELSGLLGRRDVFTTCLYAVIDPRAGTLQLASAGHPPPLLIRDGTVRVLEGRNGPPIGALKCHSPYQATAFEVRPGDVLALYTDGVVERRDEVIDQGIERLGKGLLGFLAIAGPSNDGPDLETVIVDVVGPTPTDDSALVLVSISSV
jgi:hypothetical protein